MSGSHVTLRALDNTALQLTALSTGHSLLAILSWTLSTGHSLLASLYWTISTGQSLLQYGYSMDGGTFNRPCVAGGVLQTALSLSH